ncbi:hypothetical protein HDN1F_21240 [gamma proteobacterium HdN1]|nr:hypothetical protein HDN1F_21240 [gamma proteobacterium HdN1]
MFNMFNKAFFTPKNTSLTLGNAKPKARARGLTSSFGIKTALAASLLTISSFAFAAELTDANIAQWVKATSAVKEWSKQNENAGFMPTTPNPEVLGDPTHAFSLALRDIKSQPQYGALEGVLKSNGYSNPDEWAALGDQVVRAWMANEFGSHKTTSVAALEASLAELKTANLPPAMHDKMERSIKVGIATFKIVESTPEADKAAIKRNTQALDHLFKSKN